MSQEKGSQAFFSTKDFWDFLNVPRFSQNLFGQKLSTILKLREKTKSPFLKLFAFLTKKFCLFWLCSKRQIQKGPTGELRKACKLIEKSYQIVDFPKKPRFQIYFPEKTFIFFVNILSTISKNYRDQGG